MSVETRRYSKATMATPMKYMYNPAYFERLCPVLREAIPGFDCRYFIFRIFNNTWPDLELKQRVRHIAMVLRDFLSRDFQVASQQVVSIALRLRNEGRVEQNLGNLFRADYIELYGLDYPDESLMAFKEITAVIQRFHHEKTPRRQPSSEHHRKR